jgi:hypothetical protein
MDEHNLLKSWSRLEMLHQHLPSSDVKENYVADYHVILKTIEQETGLTLNEFSIADSELRFKFNTIPPTLYNDFQGQTMQSEFRYCGRAFFLMRLEAAMLYIRSLIPSETKRHIGF